MTSDNNPFELDADAQRLLREAAVTGEVSILRDEIIEEARAQIEDTDRQEALVDMTALLAYFGEHRVDTTWSGGGCTRGALTDLPSIMFPHLSDLELVLHLFEKLAWSIADTDILQAIYHHVGSTETIYAGERRLHHAQDGVRMHGGRIVDVDHTWAVEISCIAHEHWVAALYNFDRVVPAHETPRARMWQFTVYMPIGHAERLNRAAQVLLH